MVGAAAAAIASGIESLSGDKHRGGKDDSSRHQQHRKGQGSSHRQHGQGEGSARQGHRGMDDVAEFSQTVLQTA